MSNIRDASSVLTKSSANLFHSSEELAERVIVTNDALQATSVGAKQLSGSVENNLEFVEKVFCNTQEARQLAFDGQSTGQRAVDVAESLCSQAKQILSVIEFVNSLSFSTNLLALNAAVEAARAGEQGKGFAVVASEVRKLAQKSSEASHDIEKLLR